LDRQTLTAIKNKAFDKQLEFINSTSKRRILFVPRRGAKTTAIAILFLLYVLALKNIRLIFFALSGENAEYAFIPAIKPILEEYDIIEGRDFTYNKTERLFEFLETNSTICLKGMDSSYKDMDKVLGGRCFAIAIDECQNQTQDIDKAINKNIQPAVSDYIKHGGGIIILAGTAGDFMGDNFWYKLITSPNHGGWEFFSWEGKDNPYMKEAKEEEEKIWLEMYGESYTSLAWYRQQYLNEWVCDGDRKVYHLSNFNILGQQNCKEPFPSKEFLFTAKYILGMDFGFYPDPMAFVIGCYNLKYSNKLFIIDEFQANNMLIGEVASKIKELDMQYKFFVKVADAGAQAKAQVADLNDTYNLYIIPADKAGKLSHQNMINSDFLSQQIFIHPNCVQLINQAQNLIWDPIQLAQSKRVEKQSMPNDLLDSMLYLHHYSRHAWYKSPVIKMNSQQDEFIQKIIENDIKESKFSFINRNKNRFNPYKINKII